MNYKEIEEWDTDTLTDEHGVPMVKLDIGVDQDYVYCREKETGRIYYLVGLIELKGQGVIGKVSEMPPQPRNPYYCSRDIFLDEIELIY